MRAHKELSGDPGIKGRLVGTSNVTLSLFGIGSFSVQSNLGKIRSISRTHATSCQLEQLHSECRQCISQLSLSGNCWFS